MSVKIRLARGGSKNNPFHKIVVAESRAPRDGDFIERIGSYNPTLPSDHSGRLIIDVERAKYWMSKGAQPSERIAKILANLGVGQKPAIPKSTKAHLPKTKAQERMKAEEDAKAKAAEAAKASVEKPAETPAETPAA